MWIKIVEIDAAYVNDTDDVRYKWDQRGPSKFFSSYPPIRGHLDLICSLFRRTLTSYFQISFQSESLLNIYINQDELVLEFVENDG